MHRNESTAAGGTEATAAGVSTDRELLALRETVRFFRRHWLLVLGFALGCLAIVLLFVVLTPRTYEAAATLVVIPPRFSSELKPRPLSVQGYQRLLESDGVVTETRRELMEDGTLVDGDSLRVGVELVSRIFVSRRAEETALAPVIEAIGRAASPEAAASVANTWARIFLDRSRDLTAGSVQPTIEFIETQFQAARRELEILSGEYLETADDYQRRIDGAEGRWDRTLDATRSRWDRELVGFQKDSEDLVAEYQTTTRQDFEAFGARVGLIEPGREGAPPTAGEEGEVGVETAPRAVDGGALVVLDKMMSLRIQLAQTPQFLVLEKAMSDDALWQMMALGQSEHLDLQDLPLRNLLTQEVNPVFSELMLRLSEIELQMALLNPETRDWVRRVSAGLERLQRQRSAGLSKLFADRATELDVLEEQKRLELDELRRKMDQELASLQRQRDARLGELDRDLVHARDLFDELASNYNEADLARATEDMEDVRLGSPAVPSLQPVDRLLPLKAFAALILGSILGTAVALGRELV